MRNDAHRALTLPTYDLGPGRGTDELIANAVIYGVLGALFLSLAWFGWLFWKAIVEDRRTRGPSATFGPPARRRAEPEA